ncbi:glycosyltransferase [Paenibacillus macerans]|uniref:glycosyltransferase n=1 Tax=Paenibacillus macerans TaxID=44252 RepID=UPI003D31471D
MKIAYLLHWNEGPESGVFKKVVGQALAWRALGHETALFLFSSRAGDAWEEAGAGGVPIVCETYGGKLGRTPRFKALVGKLRGWQPDVVYHRFDLYYPALPRLLRDYPSVLEINTNDVTELALEGWSGLPRRVYHLLTRRRVLAAAGGFVFVSGELAEADGFRRFAKDLTVIGNGIPLERVAAERLESGADAGATTEAITSPSVSPTTNPATNLTTNLTTNPTTTPNAIRFVFLGSAGQSWHGVDEIARLAAARPDWRFDVVGLDRAELETEGAVPLKPLPANMAFHGKLTRSRYQPLLDQADIAIGTLALHRKGMEEASPLKVREYLANGLPVITAYRDTDFPQPVPFMLQLPNEPGNAVRHLTAIERFAGSWAGRRVAREHIRHLDAAVKEAARVEYMRRIVGLAGDKAKGRAGDKKRFALSAALRAGTGAGEQERGNG